VQFRLIGLIGLAKGIIVNVFIGVISEFIVDS